MTVVLYICCVLCLCIVPATWVVFQYAIRYACIYECDCVLACKLLSNTYKTSHPL